MQNPNIDQNSENLDQQLGQEPVENRAAENQPNNLVNNVANNVSEGVTNLADKTTDTLKNVGSNVSEQVGNLAGNVSGVAQDVAGKAAEGVANVANVAGDTLKGVVSTVAGKPVGQPLVQKSEKLFAAIAYIPFVAIVSLILKPDSAFVRMHSRQALMLAIIFLFIGVFAALVSIIPFIGPFLAVVLALVPTATIVIGAYSLYLALTGFWWKIPVIGELSEIIPIELFAKIAKENISGDVTMARVDYENREETLAAEQAEKTSSDTAATTTVPTETVDSVQESNIPQNEDAKN